jgi:D-hydroxyproline dehydrogenase subunit gamma
MNRRVTANVDRPAAVSIVVNGVTVPAYEGESLMTALMASGRLAFTRGRFDRARGPFCNMGICFDCLVLVEDPARPDAMPTRLRSCLTTVRDGLRVTVAEIPAAAVDS